VLIVIWTSIVLEVTFIGCNNEIQIQFLNLIIRNASKYLIIDDQNLIRLAYITPTMSLLIKIKQIISLTFF
jgi:hypothetical protein